MEWDRYGMGRKFIAIKDFLLQSVYTAEINSPLPRSPLPLPSLFSSSVGTNKKRKGQERQEKNILSHIYSSIVGLEVSQKIDWQIPHISLQGGVGLLAHYDNNLAEAITDAFPEIGLNQSLFSALRGTKKHFVFFYNLFIYNQASNRIKSKRGNKKQ